MWRIVLLSSLVLALVAGACGGGGAPASHEPPTVTPVVKGQPTLCQQTHIPSATLSFAEQEQDRSRVAVNWNTADCPISSHPINILPLPDEPMRVLAGEQPQLAFSAVPVSVSGYAWQPDFSAAQTAGEGTVSIDQSARSANIDLMLEPAATQLLPISGLPPGDYAVEIFAGWPEGTTGYAFRVLIEASP